MKKILCLASLILSSCIQAQVGVNTSKVTSTLTVNGSISGKYTEIRASNYQIQQDDYNIAYLGGNEQKGTFVLPKVKNDTIDFAGRIYYIKNVSKDKTVQIKAAESEFIRFGGALDARTFIDLLPGRFVALIANNSSNYSTWDMNMLGLEEKPPEVKTVEYLKIAIPLDRNYNIEDELSVIQLGNLKIGYQSIGGGGQIMFKLNNNNFATTWVFRSGNGQTMTASKDFYPLKPNTWNTIQLGASSIMRNDDMLTINLVAYNTQEIYRITIYSVNQINISGFPPLAPGMVVYFIEKIA